MNENWVGACVKVEKGCIVFQMGYDVHKMHKADLKEATWGRVLKILKIGTLYLLELSPNRCVTEKISGISGGEVIFDRKRRD